MIADNCETLYIYLMVVNRVTVHKPRHINAAIVESFASCKVLQYANKLAYAGSIFLEHWREVERSEVEALVEISVAPSQLGDDDDNKSWTCHF